MAAEVEPAGPLTAAEQARLRELLAEPEAPAWAGPLREDEYAVCDAEERVVAWADQTGFHFDKENLANAAALVRLANAYAELVPLVRRLLDGAARGTEVPRGR